MSNPFTVNPLTSVRAWNAILASACPTCCEMPECLEPEIECEKKEAEALAVGYTFDSWRAAIGVAWADGFSHDDVPCPDLSYIWRRVSQTSTYTTTNPEGDPYSLELVATVDEGAVYSSLGLPTPVTFDGDTFSGGPVDAYDEGTFSGTFTEPEGNEEEYLGTYTATVEFSEQVTEEMLFEEAVEKLGDAEWEESDACSAYNQTLYNECRGGPSDQPLVTTLRSIRRRFTVPTLHTGTYYRVMWDIIDEPEGWDDTIPDPEDPEGPEIPDPSRPLRSFVSQDNEWEWESPESRTSDWFAIDRPTTPGVRRMVNLRVFCYRGPFGTLPTLFGDQVILDEDPPEEE